MIEALVCIILYPCKILTEPLNLLSLKMHLCQLHAILDAATGIASTFIAVGIKVMFKKMIRTEAV